MPKIGDRKGTDGVVARFTITCHENGAMSVEGPIDNYEYAMAVLENAKDAIRNRRTAKDRVVVPHYDVELPRIG